MGIDIAAQAIKIPSDHSEGSELRPSTVLSPRLGVFSCAHIIMSGREEFDWERMRREEDDYFAVRNSEPKTIRIALANIMREARKIEHRSEVEADGLARLEKLSYRDYLKSDYWQSKRQTILERDRFQCRDCGSRKRLNVHHKNYLALRGQERDADLLTLCRRCHIARHREKIPGRRR